MVKVPLASVAQNIRKRRHIYIFNPEDLDNADIISYGREVHRRILRDKTYYEFYQNQSRHRKRQIATEEATGDSEVAMGGVE